MKVSIIRGGGLAGVAIRTELSTDDLPDDVARSLEQRAGAIAPAREAPGSRSPDEMLYIVVVESGDGRREAHYTDGTLPDAVRELIALTDERPEKREEIGG